MEIYGLELPELADGTDFRAIDAIVILKGYVLTENESDDETLRLQYREIVTGGLTPPECYGMSMACADTWREYLTARSQT